MTNNPPMAASDFTTQRLFGAPGPDVLEFGEFLERARFEREREHADNARCAVGAYVVVRLVASWMEVRSSDDPEAFTWQAATVRRHVEDLPQDREDVAHLQGILGALGERQRRSDLRIALLAFTDFLEQVGRTAEALAVLRLVARTHRDRLTPARFAGIAIRAASLYHQSGAWNRSRGAYLAAEEAARCAGDVPLALKAVLGQARGLCGQGETAAARSMVEGVLAASSGSRLKDICSEAHALLSTLLRLQGDPLQGIQAGYRAVRLASASPARWQRLFDLGAALADQGYGTPAQLAFQAAVASDSRILGASAKLELMDLASAAADRLGFERYRVELVDLASAAGDRLVSEHERSVAPEIGRWPVRMAVDYQFRLGVGLARFGQFARARAAWTDALALAGENHLHGWCRRLEDRLEQDPAEVQAEGPSVPPEESPPVIIEVTAWLRRGPGKRISET